MARPYGITFACTKGQPSHLMMEYFTDELKKAKIDFENDTVFIFTVSDWDSAGASIRHNMLKFLSEKAGIKHLKTYNLIDLKNFDDEMVSFARTKAIRFYKDANGNPCPLDGHKTIQSKERGIIKAPLPGKEENIITIDPETLELLLSENEPWNEGEGREEKKEIEREGAREAILRSGSNSKFTRIYNWWNSLGDQKERLITKDYIGGRWVYTIWKVSADALDWYEVERDFRKVMEGIDRE